MRDPCKTIFSLLAIAVLLGTNLLPAASLRWVHLGTADTGLAGLAVDEQIAYRKMPPGKTTPWGAIAPGLHRFQVASEKNPGSAFELDVQDGQKITLISVVDKNGDIHSRTHGLEKPQGEVFILNMLPGVMMDLPETEIKAIFGKGIWLSDIKAKTTVSIADAEGFRAEVDFTRLADTPLDSYLAILSAGDGGKPSLTMLRSRDSLFEMSDESIEIPSELAAGIRIISMGNIPAPGSFDPAGVNWDEVDSRIFWLNLMIDRDPCRLEISGFPAMRRMPSGRGSGFVKWPSGNWKTNIVAERTSTKLSDGSFSLSAKASMGLISSGGGKFPHRLLSLEGRPQEKSGEALTSRIRFVNALPDGVLEATIPLVSKPIELSLKPGESSEIVPIKDERFPGATLNYSLGATKKRPITKIPPMPKLPQGDWVVVVHLDQESFDAPVLTWVEMDQGSILSPDSRDSGE
jgi:hypothetical protein